MRAVVQRVSGASVTINDVTRASIATGLLVLVAFEEADSPRPKILNPNPVEPRELKVEPGPMTLDTVDGDIEWLAGKIVRLRIFNDEQGLMNRSVADVGPETALGRQCAELHRAAPAADQRLPPSPAVAGGAAGQEREG